MMGTTDTIIAQYFSPPLQLNEGGADFLSLVHIDLFAVRSRLGLALGLKFLCNSRKELIIHPLSLTRCTMTTPPPTAPNTNIHRGNAHIASLDTRAKAIEC